MVTCFYTEQEAALADAIREALHNGQPLAPIFSRRRSLRQRMNRNDENDD